MTFLPVLLFFFFFQFSDATVTMKLVNKCPHAIWPGLHGRPMPDVTGLKMDAGQEHTLVVADGWTAGRIWARTGCTGEDGSLHCQTGGCGNKIQCEGRTGATPCSLAEFTLNANKDFYDVSFVDGSNIPITIKPIDGTYEHHDGQYNCAAAGECSRDLRHVVDDSLKFVVDGHVVGTKSACSATHEPKFCCTGEYNKPETCKKSNFPDKYYGDLKKVCPTTYLYAYDDHSSTFTCKGKNNHSPEYTITFCSV